MRSLSSLAFLFVSSLAACSMPNEEAPTAGEEVAAEHAELRRVDFLQRRSLAMVDQAGTVHANLPIDFANTWSTGMGMLRDRAVTSVAALHWAGDANTYLDVFDVPLAPGGTYMFPGSVARFRYPWASNSQTTRPMFCFPGSTCPTATPVESAVRLDLASTFGGRPARAFRLYDRGECAGEATWSDVVGSIGRAIAERLDAALRAKGMSGATLRSVTGTPLLGADTLGGASDGVMFRAEYDVNNCSGRMYISFRGRFSASGNRPTFSLDAGTVRVSLDFGDDFCAGWLAIAGGFGTDAGALQTSISTQTRDELTAQLAPSITAALVARTASAPISISCAPTTDCLPVVRSMMTLGGFTAAASALLPNNAACLPRLDRPGNECKFVPNVRRINTRSDGIELVLANHRADPFLAPLSSAPGDLCRRPEPPAAPTLGFTPLANPLAPTMMSVAAVSGT